MNYNDFINHIMNISLVVSIVFFFFSLIQMIQEKKLLSHYLLFIIYFSTAIQFLSFWLYCRDSPVFERYFYYSDSAFLFLIGPSLYFFLYYMTGHRRISLTEILLNGIPFIVALLFIVVVNLFHPQISNKSGHPLILFIVALSCLSFFLYSIRTHRFLSSHYRENRTPEIKALIFSIQGCIVFSFILSVSVIWRELLVIGNIAFICIPLFGIFFFVRYPRYFHHVQKEIREMKYANSQLKGIDKREFVSRLNSLMTGEKIYRRSTLTLKELSDEMGLSPLQLSEFLNSHYDSNFNNFVNSYRVEEVKAILEEESEANILQTAIDCGFNSKTTFNRVFRNHTGLTPSQFREKRAYQFIN